MNLTRSDTPNKWSGGNRCEVIIIHWWGSPSSKPTLSGVLNHLTNPAPGGNPQAAVSAHYVASGDSVVQLAEETDRVWHAMRANDFAIGIEVDPNTPGNTYKTLGELVRDIRSRRGNIPLKRHSDYVSTACPGNIYLGRIEEEAKGEDMKSVVAVNRHQARLWYVDTLGRDYNKVTDAEADGVIGKNIEELTGQFVYGEKNPADRVEWHERNQKAKAFDGVVKQLGELKAGKNAISVEEVNRIKKELADVDAAVEALKR